MKISIAFMMVSASVLAACAGASDVGVEEETAVSEEQELRGNFDHPDFVRKMRDPANYRVDRDRDMTTESICGVDNMQHVNRYDGTLGPTPAFVAARKRPVGALETTASSGSAAKYCTGTLISTNRFLTAGHCVDSATVGDYVAFNYETGPTAPYPVLAQSHYRVNRILEDSLGGVDYAILELAGSPGSTWGVTVPANSDPAVGAALTIIQHPNREPKQIEAGTRSGLSGNYMTYGNIDTEPGSSGSGIINASQRLVGVHTNGGCTASGGTNSGVRMTRIFTVSALL